MSTSASGVHVFRRIKTLSPQVAELTRVLPDPGKDCYSRINTILDPRILTFGGYVDLTAAFPDGILPERVARILSAEPGGHSEEGSASTACVLRRLHVPRHIVTQGAEIAPGIRSLTPLQAAYNELVRAVHDPDPRVSKAQRRRAVETMLSNLLSIAAQDVRRIALTETVRFRAPGALRVCVVDERLGPWQIGLSRASIRRLFGDRPRPECWCLVGRYPTFAYLPARAVELDEIGDAVGVSPAWLETEGGERTFLDLLEGDCDGDMLVVLPAPNARCADEIRSRIPRTSAVPHESRQVEIPGLHEMLPRTEDHLQAALAKRVTKVYIPHIISCLYRSWVVHSICSRFGIETGLTAEQITNFWKAIAEGCFDLKHGSSGSGAAEDLLLAFTGRMDYEKIAATISRIEKMPAEGVDIGRRIWSMPRLLGDALRTSIHGGDLIGAASVSHAWSVLEDNAQSGNDGPDGMALARLVAGYVRTTGLQGLGRAMLHDVYGLKTEETGGQYNG